MAYNNNMEKIDLITFPDNWKGRTQKLAVALLYATGMRLSELINLKESQLDRGYCQVKVLGKGNKERIIPLSEALLKEIEKYISDKPKQAEGTTHLLVIENGKPLYPKYLYNAVKQTLSQVTTVKKKSPHVLRHSFATHLINNGAEIKAIKDLLGHSSLAATQIYTHNSIEKLKEVYKKAHPKG
jgi:integrase/recombinase XerC